ncbi:MAG TPA: MarR family transcriptional regulator [Terracidiphilus sp.]|jgi:DNA-binding MarR family transcriptional regulator
MSTEKRDNSTELADQLHSAAIHLLRKLRREDAASGLNAPRLSALSVVVFAGPVTLGDLASAEQVRPPTMTRIIDALALQGLVVKKRNAQDARSTLIHATAAGKKLLLQGRERRVRALAEQILALGGDDRAALERAAEILRCVIKKI